MLKDSTFRISCWHRICNISSKFLGKDHNRSHTFDVKKVYLYHFLLRSYGIIEMRCMAKKVVNMIEMVGTLISHRADRRLWQSSVSSMRCQCKRILLAHCDISVCTLFRLNVMSVSVHAHSISSVQCQSMRTVSAQCDVSVYTVYQLNAMLVYAHSISLMQFQCYCSSMRCLCMRSLSAQRDVSVWAFCQITAMSLLPALFPFLKGSQLGDLNAF